MKVKVIKHNAHPYLTYGKVYLVIGIEADSYRIVDESNEPVLHYPSYFEVVDKKEPEEWITEYGEDGERYSYPPILNDMDFFGDWHDGDQETRRIFSDYLKKLKDKEEGK